MGPFPVSLSISVYICSACVRCNVVSKDPRWGLLPVSLCISVYICWVRVWYIMLSVGTQDGTITTLCVY
jgi:hypothetical protein